MRLLDVAIFTIGLGSASLAFATDYTAPDVLVPGNTDAQFLGTTLLDGDFSDTYSFSTGDVTGTLVAAAKALYISDGSITLFANGTPIGKSPFEVNFIAALLPDTSYTYLITGSADDPTYYGNYNFEIQIAAVPEPETYALLGLGLVALVAARSRALKAKRGNTLSHTAQPECQA